MRGSNLLLTLCCLQCQWLSVTVLSQRTQIDDVFQPLNTPLRLMLMQIFGRASEEPKAVQRAKSFGRLQKISPRNQRHFCNTTNGRSPQRPTTVHRLRPGDIDVIGALGDSLTAGNGLLATQLLNVFVENRGESWSIGGVGNWRQYLTIPNILKEFNPNLYGYSVRDGAGAERTSKFNTAEPGAMSRDIPYMAKVLHKRMQRDPKVNMTTDWKLVTLLIGGNDFCADFCFMQNPENAIKMHERDMVTAFRFLRDNIPRLMLNIIPPPNVMIVRELENVPTVCKTTLVGECPCFMGRHRSPKEIKFYARLMDEWLQKDIEIAKRSEFNTDTFTINLFSGIQFDKFLKNEKGKVDIRFMAPDCFHASQAGDAIAVNVYWNSMFGKPDEVTKPTRSLMEVFRCPTAERPYISTRENIKTDFII